MNFGKEEMRRRSARVAVFHIHALVNHILRYCDYSSLSRVSCVCKTLYDFALRAPLWVKLLESHYGSVLSGRISVQSYKKFFSACYASEQALTCPGKPSYTHTRELYSGEQTPLCISFDQRHFMSGHIDKTVKVWDCRTGRQIDELRGHGSWIKCLDFDDDHIVTGSYDSELREWDRANHKCVGIFKGHGTNLNGRQHTGSPRGSVVCLHMDRKYIVSGSNDNTVRVWQRVSCPSTDGNGNANDGANSWHPGTESELPAVRTIRPTLTLTGHTQTVRCIQFRDNVICSGGSDRVIRVWDIASGTETRTLGGNQGWDGNNVRFGHTHRVSCLQMGPLGNQCLVISGSNDKTACLWDTRLHERNGFVRRLKTHDKAIRRLQFDNNKLITGGDEPLIQCFDLRDGRGGTLLRCDYLEANDELNMISSFSPCNNTDASRVSAMQYDATRLACAFTLGHTDEEGNHHRYGSIKIWDMETMMMVDNDDDSMNGLSEGTKYSEGSGMDVET